MTFTMILHMWASGQYTSSFTVIRVFPLFARFWGSERFASLSVSYVLWTMSSGLPPSIKARCPLTPPALRLNIAPLAGVLRGLWESDLEADLRDLDIYLPYQSLVKSFRSPPASFSNEVVECLFEAAHLHVTPSRRLCYAATPSDLSTRSLSGPALGMALASAYANLAFFKLSYVPLFMARCSKRIRYRCSRSPSASPRTSFSTDGSGPTSPRSPFFSSLYKPASPT